MKRCSTCNRTYTDPSLSFCIDDGTPLTTVEEEPTVVSPRGGDNPDKDWNAGAYQPPGSYVPPGTQVRARRVWPWILGIAGAFIFGIVVISIAAVILAPRLMRSGQNEQATVNTNAGNANQAENSNPAEPANSNSDGNAAVDPPPLADHEQVLAQLTDLENDWTVANINADKQKLDRILADDYVGQAGEDGGLQSKADYIRSIRRDTQIEKWEFGDLKLMLAGDRATLTGKITYVIQGAEVVFEFKDKFVWRDGRWQATGSELKRTKE